MEGKPLTPLAHGSILIVGTMSGNFGSDIRENPRVIMWDSQHESWLRKSVPDNVRAIFVTRWVGHDAFTNIIAEARKRQLTIFNPMGTGLIAKQVRELLGLSKQNLELPQDTEKKEEIEMPKSLTHGEKGKLKPLHKFINSELTDAQNAHNLMIEAKKMGIDTTLASLENSVGVLRRKAGVIRRPASVKVVEHIKHVTPKKSDVLVQMFDNLIKEMQDMRAAYIATVDENNSLKAKIAQFKKLVE